MRSKALILAAFFAVPAAAASAAPGDLVYKDCISSNTNQTSCSLLPISHPGGVNTVLDRPEAAVESPDGAQIYVVSETNDSISWYSRSAITGTLTFAGCLSGSAGTVGCTAIPKATSDGVESGLDRPGALAITPDGRSVFVVGSGDDALARFARNTSTGALTFESCVSTDSALNGECTLLSGARIDGNRTSLDGVNDVIVSPDGANIYTASFRSDALSRFGRNPSTGEFTGFQDCITPDSDVAATGTCAPLGGATSGGNNHRMDGLTTLAAAPDGKSIVGAASSSTAVTDFARGPGGVLNMGGCVSGSSTPGCSTTFDNGGGARISALLTPTDIVVSPNNDNIYVVAAAAAAASVIGRNPTTGVMEGFEGCRTSSTNTVGCAFDPSPAPLDSPSHMATAFSIAVTPDSSKLLVGAVTGDAVTVNERRASDGAFFFQRCLTTNTGLPQCGQITPGAADGLNTPLDEIRDLLATKDGKDVYALSGSDAISRFEIEGTRPPVTPPGDQPPADQPPGGSPSNSITLGRVVKNKRKGTAKLTVTVPGPGALGLDGNGIKARAATTAGAGDLKLKLKTEGNKRKKLRRKGKVRVRPLVTFTPTGGIANTESTKVKLVAR